MNPVNARETAMERQAPLRKTLHNVNTSPGASNYDAPVITSKDLWQIAHGRIEIPSSLTQMPISKARGCNEMPSMLSYNNIPSTFQEISDCKRLCCGGDLGYLGAVRYVS